MQKRIDEHRDKVANPRKYYTDWDTFPKKRQQDEIISWKQEIKSFTEQKWIFEGILKNRKE